MKTLILYKSKYGTTKKVAERLHAKKENSEVFNILDFKGNVDEFDLVYLGCSTYMGRMHKTFKQFIQKNKKVLLSKKVKVFIVGTGPESFEEIVKHNFDQESQENFHFSHVGGEYLFSEMRFLDKFIIKRVAGVTDDSSHLDDEAIEKL